jgi:hypothetical protein
VVTIENFQEEGVFVAESGIEAGFRMPLAAVISSREVA